MSLQWWIGKTFFTHRQKILHSESRIQIITQITRIIPADFSEIL